MSGAFVGYNSVSLNSATMVRVVQFWLDSQFAEGKAPTVTQVQVDSTSLVFKISLAPPDDRPHKPLANNTAKR